MSERTASPLRKRHCETRDQIYEYLKSCDHSPTIQEIGQSVNRSKSTVEHHLLILCKKGLITQNGARWRGIRLLHQEED